jgi:hypothetical protein
MNNQETLFAEARRLMNEARPLLTKEQTAAVGGLPVAPPWTEAQRQAWRERERREWASEAPDRAAMALTVAVAGCEAALRHTEAFGALRLFDCAAIDPFATLEELAEGKEGRWGAAPDPGAQREKERLFAAAHELLETRRDELAVAVEKVSSRKIWSEDLRPEDWEYHVHIVQEARRMEREDLRDYRSGESRQLLRQARAFYEAAAPGSH